MKVDLPFLLFICIWSMLALVFIARIIEWVYTKKNDQESKY